VNKLHLIFGLLFSAVGIWAYDHTGMGFSIFLMITGAAHIHSIWR
jgi:hypothetical protein